MDFLRRALTSSWTGNPSTKRLVALMAGVCLLLVLLAVGGACAYWIAKHGDLGAGAAGALLTMSGTATTLATVVYRKREGSCSPSPTTGAPAPAAGESAASTTTTSPGAL